VPKTDDTQEWEEHGAEDHATLNSGILQNVMSRLFVACSCEHCNKYSDSVKGGKYLDHLSNY
jgi:hypothetical protein